MSNPKNLPHPINENEPFFNDEPNDRNKEAYYSFSEIEKPVSVVNFAGETDPSYDTKDRRKSFARSKSDFIIPKREKVATTPHRMIYKIVNQGRHTCVHNGKTSEVLYNMIFGKWINLLLLAMPFGIASHIFGWSPLYIFWLNFTAMVPLASLLGDFTEDLAAHTNQVVGGLINASFGNAVEVVVSIQALRSNQIRVVQASMIGSIFSNLLLVLGSCFFFGGLKIKEQKYNSTFATASMALLALSSVALVLPTPFAQYYEVDDEDVLKISRLSSLALIFTYGQLLFFQLYTHAKFFHDEDDEDAQLPFPVGLGGLTLITYIISVLSDYLVESLDGFCSESGISKTFVGLIILPIVGNAVEHITAVSVAMKDKMDLAMSVAIGSSVQISLFVAPLTVLIGWSMGRDMTLNFPPFETTLFILSIIIVAICISYPRSNWLEGSLLITTYILVAVGFWHEKVAKYQTDGMPSEL